MFVLSSEIVSNKAMVTIAVASKNGVGRIGDLRSLALQSLPSKDILIETERISGRKNVMTFTYDLAGKGSL